MKEKVKRFLHYLYISIKRPEMEVLPGNLAFFFIMMLIPLLTILGIVVSNIDVGSSSLYDALISNFPSNIANLIMSMQGESSSAIGIGALLFVSLTLASKGTYSMIVTSNSVYNVKNTSIIKNKIKSVILLIVLIILFTLLLLVPVISTKVLNFIGMITKTDVATNLYFTLYKFFKYPVTFLLVFIFIKILYRYSLSAKLKGKTSYGAVFSSVLLVVVTWVYSFYIEYFSTYETYFGGISSLLSLMLYLYLISYIFVLGMNINFAREKSDQYEKIKEKTKKEEL